MTDNMIEKFDARTEESAPENVPGREAARIPRGSRELQPDDVYFDEEICDTDGKLNFYIPVLFNMDEVFGTHIGTPDSGDSVNIYANYDLETGQVSDTLELSDGERAMLLSKMDAYCQKETGLDLARYRDSYLAERGGDSVSDQRKTADTVLDEYPMPDPSVSPATAAKLNGTRKDLLPLSANRACELLTNRDSALTGKMTVFAVLPDGILETPKEERQIRDYPPDTVFAVSKREWEKSMGFHIALNERTGRQIQRERAFLRHTGNCFAVYQFNVAADASMTLEAARTGGLSPREAGYELVYAAPMTGNGDVEKLEKRFRERPPADFHHRKTGVGDIIAVKKDGKLKAWYLDLLALNEQRGMFENVPLYRTGERGERLPLTDEIPLYRETGEYAREHGESETYFASQNANVACRDAVDRAVADNYRDWCLDTDSAVRQVRDEFGYDRMLYVLACSIRHMSWDGRISRDNIRWAENFPVTPDTDGVRKDRNDRFLILKTHPGPLDMFTQAARGEYERSRPLSASEIIGEAERIFTELKTRKEPNGPNYRSFVARLSPEFTSRANEGDYIMISGMMPFRSFEITPMRDFYSSGLYARIDRDEDRESKRRLRQPTFKPRRSPAKKKKAPER